ncbi:MAG: LemA family protein [Planctomycetia bacterium]|nr:LemA family protein [Planctomycetia bacterium]
MTIVSFYQAHVKLLHAYLIADLPFSKMNGVFVGLVSVQGTAETTEPSVVPITQTPCVLHTWSISEEWQRWETETYRDKDGKYKTRKVLKRGSVTLASGSFRPPHFYVKDETGIIRVIPEKVSIPSRAILYKRITEKKNPQLYNFVNAPPVPDSTGVRCFSESGIVLHDRIFVVGNALYNDNETIVEIRDDNNGNTPYIISYSEPKHSVNSCIASYVGMLFFSLSVWFFTLFSFTSELEIPSILYGGGSVIAVLCFLCWLYVRYLAIVDLKNKVGQALSNINVQLQRRAHLIPQLVACVQGMMAYEKSIQPLFAELRSRIIGGSASIQGCVSVLNCLVERYPTITSDVNFNEFQKELINTEQKIALARTYANDVIMHYNTRIERFPECLIASVIHLKKSDYIQISDIERVTPDISLVE